MDPKAAAAYYPKPFALSATATTFNGFEAVKTGNIFILFTKVAATPQNELTGPQTSVWHFGWNTPNSRQYNEKFRAMGLTIAQMWDAADGKLVDMSSDTLPGLPTQEQILEMRAKGTQPTREGGFGYLRGPDGAMIENAQSGTTERFNHVHMYHEHPNCAMNWYVTHLGAKMPARQGAPAPTPALENCQTKTYAPPTWPSFAKTGFVRDPAGGVLIDDISISIRPWPGGGLVSTRGKIVDHWAISTANLDQTVARLKAREREVPRRDPPVGQLARGDDRRTRSHRDRDRRDQINAYPSLIARASLIALLLRNGLAPGADPCRDARAAADRDA